MGLSELFDQLLSHRLFPAQDSPEIRSGDAKHRREFVPTANLVTKPPETFERLVKRCGDGVDFVAQSLSRAEQLHQRCVGDALALAQPGKRVMGNLSYSEQFAIADAISLLNVEHCHGEHSSIVRRDAKIKRTCILADELVFLDVVGFLADRLLG